MSDEDGKITGSFGDGKMRIFFDKSLLEVKEGESKEVNFYVNGVFYPEPLVIDSDFDKEKWPRLFEHLL